MSLIKDDNTSKIIYHILDNFKKIKYNISVIQVGSSVKKDIFNDIDLLIVTDNVGSLKNDILKIFKDYETSTIDDSIKVKNYCNYEISFAIYKKSNFYIIINDYILGKDNHCNHRTWSIGYWLIEGFANDIKNGRILIDNHKIYDYQLILSKECIYANKKILKDVLEEIRIKNEYLKNKQDLVINKCLRQDIYLASLRGLSIINKTPLSGFKRIQSSIDLLNPELRKLIKNINRHNGINEIIKKISNELKTINDLYFGTWQYNGIIRKISHKTAIENFKYAKKNGIKKFDTALVYGDAEKLLSLSIDETDCILTKVPAKVKIKDLTDNNLLNYYDKNYVTNCINKSRKRLNRNSINIVLLHNWNDEWSDKLMLIKHLYSFKQKGIVEKIGISLSNGYDRRINDEVLKYIDVIEAPYNDENRWIKKDIEYYKKYNIEIILRSLFKQGKVNKNNYNYKKIIRKTLKLETSIVIGMTTKEQIKNNISYFE